MYEDGSEFNDPQALARFRAATKRYVKRVTASPQAARATLVRLGIIAKPRRRSPKPK